MRVGNIGEPSTLLAPLASDSASFDIIGLVYDTLLERDENREIAPKLAKSFEIMHGGLAFRFELHDHIKWHDGQPFTADDVVHSFNILMDPRTPSSYTVEYEKVKSVTAIDPYTVEVSYAEPYAPALGTWASFFVIPKHLVPSAEKITRNPLNRRPIGTGPYKFVSWTTGDRLVLEANDQYFEGRPNIDQYVYRIIPDQQTMFLELKSKGLDRMGLTPVQWQRQTNNKNFTKQFNKYQWNGLGYTYMGFNMARPLFKNKKGRKALYHAVNRKEIVDGVLLGLAREALGPYPPDMWYTNPNLPNYDYSAQKAMTLLSEAGYTEKDSDGYLVKNGKRFSFEVVTNQGNAQRQKTAEIMQRNFKDVGVEMNIRIVEWAAFLEKFVNTRNFDAVILGWGLGPEPDQKNFWHSTQTGPTEFNFVSYSNPEVDKLLEAGVRTFDKASRIEIYYKLQEILVEDVPYIWLYVPKSLAAVNSDVHGIEVKPAGIGYNFEHWWFAQ